MQANQQRAMAQTAQNQVLSAQGATQARGLQYEKSTALTQAAAARQATADKAVNDARQAMGDPIHSDPIHWGSIFTLDRFTHPMVLQRESVIIS